MYLTIRVQKGFATTSTEVSPHSLSRLGKTACSVLHIYPDFPKINNPLIQTLSRTCSFYIFVTQVSLYISLLNIVLVITHYIVLHKL